MSTVNQAVSIVETLGAEVTVLLRGEPGIGKSAVLRALEAKHGDKYDYVYVDCPNLDLPEYGMPEVANHVTRTAPNALWRFDSPKPKVIMLDELTKAQAHMKPVLTTTMLERRVGESRFPEGTLVFGTGNLTTDGVGDSLQGHAMNRVSVVHVEKPTAEEWLPWALSNGVDPIICAAVSQLPHCLASYITKGGAVDKNQEDNMYVYNPKKPSQSTSGAFVSPRSLFKASAIVAQRGVLGVDLTTEVLEGTVGIAFARDLMAYAQVSTQIPTWDTVDADPTGARVPKSTAAQWLMVFSSIPRTSIKNAEAMAVYFSRFDIEIRMTWARQFRDTGDKLALMLRQKQFRDLIVNEHWVFS